MGIFSLLGSALGAGASLFSADKNADLQKDFAQHGIQWKVNDAKAAGIHPLYALGANTMSFTPSTLGSELSSNLQNMGQDIDRSRMATSSPEVRGSLGKAAGILGLERASLENDKLRAEISQLRAPAVGPPLPGDSVRIVEPQLTRNLRIGGRYGTNPNFTDAQTIEDRYGDSEILSTLSAMGIGLGDLYWNMSQKRSVPSTGRTGFPRFGGR